MNVRNSNNDTTVIKSVSRTSQKMETGINEGKCIFACQLIKYSINYGANVSYNIGRFVFEDLTKLRNDSCGCSCR